MQSGRWLKSSAYAVLAVVIGTMSCLQSVWAQSPGRTAMQYRHTVTGGISAGKLVGGDAPATSQLGFDYLYRLQPKWELGVQVDFVYERGFGEFEAYAIVPIVAYSITDRFPMFFGIGVEHGQAHDENNMLVRLGGEYTFYLDKKQRVLLLPGGFVDWIDGEVNASVVLALGYMF